MNDYLPHYTDDIHAILSRNLSVTSKYYCLDRIRVILGDLRDETTSLRANEITDDITKVVLDIMCDKINRRIAYTNKTIDSLLMSKEE